MNFDCNWTIFALDAEVEAFGTSRIASAHNKLRAEVADAKADIVLAKKQTEHDEECIIELQGERDRLCAEVAALKLAVANSGTRHEYTAPPGMVFVPEDFEAGVRKDAERYRWLRNKANYARKHDPLCVTGIGPEATMLDGAELDAAIDAALGGED